MRILLLLIPSLALANGHQANPNQSQSQGQSQGAEATSTANNQGNSLAVTHQDKLQAPALGLAPVYASSPCAIGWSAGISIPGGALGGGRAKTDASCEKREWFRILRDTSPALALKIACSDPIVAAVASPEDCKYTPPVVAVPEPKTEQKPADCVTRDAMEKAFRKCVSK